MVLEDEADAAGARNCARCLASRENGSTSSRRTLPAVGRSRVPRMVSTVLLPEPLGPTMATAEAGGSEKVIGAEHDQRDGGRGELLAVVGDLERRGLGHGSASQMRTKAAAIPASVKADATAATAGGGVLPAAGIVGEHLRQRVGQGAPVARGHERSAGGLGEQFGERAVVGLERPGRRVPGLRGYRFPWPQDRRWAR